MNLSGKRVALFICAIQCMTYDYPIFSAIPQPVIPLLWPVAIVGGLAQMVRLKNVQDKGLISEADIYIAANTHQQCCWEVKVLISVFL